MKFLLDRNRTPARRLGNPVPRTAVQSMKSIHISLLGHLTLIGALLSAGLSHGRTGDRKLAMQHLAAIDAQYTDPGTPLEAAQRGMCRGFGQTEALKGTWVPHQDPSYRGLTIASKCPDFARDSDSDCNGDNIDPIYHPLAAQEYAQVFRPHACDLQPLDAGRFSQCLQGRRVIMIGDSTMRQMFQSLACILGDHIQSGFLTPWEDATSSHIHIPFDREYLIDKKPGHPVYKQYVGGFLLPNHTPVYLRSFGILNLTLWDDIMSEFMPLTSQDVIIAEFGAWYPSFDTATAIKSWTTFTTDMKQLFSERLRDLPATVLWRSYSPTHFGGELGSYKSTQEVFGLYIDPLTNLTTCQPASKGEYFFDTEIIQYLQDECGQACNHIHMLPIYHLSLLKHNSHHGSFGTGVERKKIDCRHFCNNVVDVWNLVLYHKLCLS
ncbi:g9846 [Coccomyxa viridis]|uniref:G9846 protein n=1 Tax=Coccomyxa viridis TaxID=1274662 RepID=A0ABP1G867_9CHLO